jgi:hypothetical protein
VGGYKTRPYDDQTPVNTNYVVAGFIPASHRGDLRAGTGPAPTKLNNDKLQSSNVKSRRKSKQKDIFGIWAFGFQLSFGF